MDWQYGVLPPLDPSTWLRVSGPTPQVNHEGLLVRGRGWIHPGGAFAAGLGPRDGGVRGVGWGRRT